MPALKLANLPDRTPVKVTLAMNPDLHQRLLKYSEVHQRAYGKKEPEPVSEIMLAMVQSFMDGDRLFAKALKEQRGAGNGTVPVQAKVATR